MRRAADVGLDEQVAHQEIHRVGVVGEDAADPGGGQEHDVRFFLLEESLRRCRVFQVQLGMGARDKIVVALALQLAHDRAARQAAMAGNVDFGFKGQSYELVGS